MRPQRRHLQRTSYGDDHDRRGRCMAFIGEALASWLALEQPMATGLIAALAYLGPRGSEVLFIRWFAARVEKGG
ncbi:Hypothetical protein SM2011_b20916 (plasmid) [Sinorhizobium meliloti 2011]|nr:Hypothetical protein SM2011_b20916 [Sinorhizobium meliloti 2011]